MKLKKRLGENINAERFLRLCIGDVDKILYNHLMSDEFTPKDIYIPNLGVVSPRGKQFDIKVQFIFSNESAPFWGFYLLAQFLENRHPYFQIDKYKIEEDELRQ